MRLYLTTNSPGEVATWVRPVVAEVERIGQEQGREIDVYIFVTPCRYASGEEARVLETLPHVKRVFSIKETARFALAGRAPSGFRHQGPGVLLFLGGEMKLAAWLSARIGVPAAVYTEGFLNSSKAFQRVYVPYESARQRVLRRGAQAHKVRVVGNLMVDSVQPFVTAKDAARRALGLGKGPVVAIFPGSREFEWRVMVPFFARVLRELRERIAGLDAVLAVSPFSETLKERYALDLPNGTSKAVSIEGEPLIAAAGMSHLAIQAADLILTVPGSNTMEAAALGRAMVVALPLYHPEEIPLDGLAGMIGEIPLVGRHLKRRLVLEAAKRASYTALPNRLAGRYLVPELKGESLQPWEVTTVAYELLMNDDVREEVATELRSVAGPQGAARLLLDDLLPLASYARF